MPSQPTKPYDSDKLLMLTMVLDEALLATTESFKGMTLNVAQVELLTAHLGKVLIDEYAAGETNPERLKKIAIESIHAPAK